MTSRYLRVLCASVVRMDQEVDPWDSKESSGGRASPGRCAITRRWGCDGWPGSQVEMWRLVSLRCRGSLVNLVECARPGVAGRSGSDTLAFLEPRRVCLS